MLGDDQEALGTIQDAGNDIELDGIISYHVSLNQI